LTLQNGFAARWCFWFSANDSSIEQVCPYLVYTMCKKREWKRSIAANKMHSLQPTITLKVRKCTVPSNHLRCETRALATFQIIGKARKQGKAIWIKCVVCSYFHKILHSFQFFFKENVRHPVWTCWYPISLIIGTRVSLILGTRW